MTCNVQSVFYVCLNTEPTPCRTVEKITVAQLVKKFTTAYGIRRMFITIFTRAAHLFYTKPNEFNPYHPAVFL
jgi:hypothetical protein